MLVAAVTAPGCAARARRPLGALPGDPGRSGCAARTKRKEGDRVLGALYEDALTGLARPEIEHADGRRTPLRIDDWLHVIPGDLSILDRCQGPTLDVGSGPGRLTVALAERGVPRSEER